MHLVTGGGGFIGSHLVEALNERGVTDILVVEESRKGCDSPNLADCTVTDCIDADTFRRMLRSDGVTQRLDAIFHQGACTDTMQLDETYMTDNNTRFSKELLDLAFRKNIPMIYASSAAVYGGGKDSVEVPENEVPLNPYGVSKLAFDRHVRSVFDGARNTLVGLRYYNVYGPNEAQKGRMASMVYQVYRQLRRTGVARLFEGTDGYEDGEQRRDFVFVGDVVKVNLFFAERPQARGIVNVGTGSSRSFNDIANILIRLLGRGRIEYVPFNRALEGKYQSFTQADLTNLRGLGYDGDFTSLEAGIERCLTAWQQIPD